MSRTPSYDFPHHPPVPPEHGAWAMLIASVVLGSWVARTWQADLLPLCIGIGFLFLARYPLVLMAMRFRWFHLQQASFFRERVVWALFYGGIGVALVWGPLMRLPMGVRLFFVGMAALFIGFEGVVAAIQARKTVLSELVATAGITLVGPFLYATQRGGFDKSALLLWGLLCLHFFAGVLYVRMLIRSTHRDVNLADRWVRVRFFLLPCAVAVLGIVVTGFMMWQGVASGWVWLAYWLPLPRLMMGYSSLGGVLSRERLKRIGWREVGYTILFVGFVGASGLG